MYGIKDYKTTIISPYKIIKLKLYFWIQFPTNTNKNHSIKTSGTSVTFKLQSIQTLQAILKTNQLVAKTMAAKKIGLHHTHVSHKELPSHNHFIRTIIKFKLYSCIQFPNNRNKNYPIKTSGTPMAFKLQYQSIQNSQTILKTNELIQHH